MKIGMKFEGGDDIARAMDGLSTRLSRKIQVEVLMEGGEPMRALVARHAPREPGRPDLADNIHMKAVRRTEDMHEKETAVGIGVPKQFFYDWFNEFGTVRMGPRPFWRPGFDSQAPKSLGIIGQAFWRELAGRGIGRTVSAPTPVQSPGALL